MRIARITLFPLGKIALVLTHAHLLQWQALPLHGQGDHFRTQNELIFAHRFCLLIDSFSHTDLTHFRTQRAHTATLGLNNNLSGLGAGDRDQV